MGLEVRGLEKNWLEERPDMKLINKVFFEDEGKDVVKSPFIGNFYLHYGLYTEPFVKRGDSVVPGKVLCAVNYMNIYNHIECEIYGKVDEILVDHEQPVYPDQPLMIIKAPLVWPR